MNTRKINCYVYVLAVSKRARQLLKGDSKPLVPYDEFNAIKIAKEEIDKGLVIPFIPSEVMEKINKEEAEEIE